MDRLTWGRPPPPAAAGAAVVETWSKLLHDDAAAAGAAAGERRPAYADAYASPRDMGHVVPRWRGGQVFCSAWFAPRGGQSS